MPDDGASTSRGTSASRDDELSPLSMDDVDAFAGEPLSTKPAPDGKGTVHVLELGPSSGGKGKGKRRRFVIVSASPARHRVALQALLSVRGAS